MSLEGVYDHDNIFAKIIRGEAPCHKFLDDEAALGMMDIFPQSPGHALILPKFEARNIMDADPAGLQALITRVQRVTAAAKAVFQPDGVVVMQFNGAPAGQTVFHLHFHVIPRYEGAALKGHGKAGRADDAALAEQAKKMAAAIENS